LTGAAISRIGNVILADHYSANEYSPKKDKFSQLDFFSLGGPGGGARNDKEVILAETTSGKRLAAIPCDDHNLVAADCDYSGHWCATGHAYRGFRADVGAVAKSFGAVNIIDRRTGESIRLLHPEGVRSVAFSPNGERLAVAGDSGVVELIDISGFKAVHGLLAAQRKGLSKRNIPDFGVDMLQSVVEDRAITAAIHRRAINLHTQAVNAVAFAPDGERVVTGGADGSVKFGGVDGHDYGTAFTNPTPILDVAWSRDGQKLLALTGAGELKIWQIRRADPMEEARTLVSKANSLVVSGACSEALQLYDSAVARYRSYLQARREDQVNMQFAGLLTTRGAARAQCALKVDAAADFRDAIQLCEDGNRGATNALWSDQLRKTLLNRAAMLITVPGGKEARQDLDRVVKNAQEYEKLEGESTALQDDLARAYSAEATLSIKAHDLRGALQEFSKAIAVFESIKEFRAPEISMSFARCLHNRAIAYAERGDLTAAIKDVDRSIEIMSEVIDLGVVGAKQELDSTMELRKLITRKAH
jgi:tetratricopeptide (TPR) repeat protein